MTGEAFQPAADDWDQHWERYAAAARRNPAQQMRHRLVVRLLQQTTATTGRILDVGSGQGDLLVRLRKAFPRAELAGFEMSRTGVEITLAKVPSARVIEADLFSPPDAVAAFHGWATHAVCSEVLEHLDEPLEFLRITRAYLAQRAVLVITVPGGPMSAFDRHIGHRRHFDPATLREMLARAGFVKARVYRAGFPFFNLYRLLVIARGERLATDVNGVSTSPATRLANAMMAIFRVLFALNARDSPWGWQLVAVAHNEPEAKSR